MRLATVTAALILAAGTAHGAGCERSAPGLLSCWHPTARYTGCQDLADGTFAVYFSGGITGRPYQMVVGWQQANGFARFIPLSDNAVVPLNTTCTASQWQPLQPMPN